MKNVVFLSIVFPFLLYIVNNGEVLASNPRIEIENLLPTDPRLQPQKYCDTDRCTPTIRPVPAEKFDVGKDVVDIYNAMIDDGTNEHAIIRILTRLASIQRLELARYYKILKFKSLLIKVKSEVSGRFEDSIVAVLLPLPVFYAEELQKSILPPIADEQTLVEILCTVNNFGIKSIVEYYRDHYGRSLENDIIKDTTGSFQKVLVYLIQGQRAEGEMVDNDKAAADAQALNQPTAKPWKDKAPFSDIFGTRSYPHLKKVFLEYEKASGNEIEDDIRKEFPGPDGVGLLEIVKRVRSKTKFFADKLDDSMQKKGAEMDRPLIRILVSRSEIDLEDIKIEYEKIYKMPLEKAVAGKIGGDYRRTLTNIIRGNGVPPGLGATSALGALQAPKFSLIPKVPLTPADLLAPKVPLVFNSRILTSSSSPTSFRRCTSSSALPPAPEPLLALGVPPDEQAPASPPASGFFPF